MLYSQERNPVPAKHKAVRPTACLDIAGEEKKSLAPTRIRTLNHPFPYLQELYTKNAGNQVMNFLT
jgi:hypothetical protein